VTPNRPLAAPHHARGFWLVGYVFAVTMAFAAVPAPLYVLYAKEDHFGPFAVTAIFAAYAVGVALSLYLAGHLSDRFGRLRLIAPAVVLNVAAALIFVVWHDLSMLMIARFVSGLGVGLLTATATAHMAELHRVAHPGRSTTLPEVVSTAANLGGIGLGPLIGGLLAQFAPAPLFTPYIVFLFLMVAGLLAIVIVPETVSPVEGPWHYRPQRVSAPAGARVAFGAAAVVAFVSFALFGFFTSLAPSFLSSQLHVTSHALAGLLSFLVFGSAAVAQIVTARMPKGAFYPVGVIGLAVGLVVVVVGILDGDLATLIAGGVIVGAGAGVGFKAAVGDAIRIASPTTRGETLATLFLIAYLGITVPVVLLGVLLEFAPTAPSIIAFGVVMLALLALAAILIRSTHRRTQPRRQIT
jgi:predicted MFS family arabinose efflux permease